MHPQDLTPLTLWQRWWTANRRAESTVRQYRADLERLSDHAEGRPLLELDRLTIEDFVLRRASDGAATGRMAFRAVRSFYGWAADRKVIDSNPTLEIAASAEHTNPAPATAQAEDVQKLIESIDTSHDHGIRDAAFIAALWSTGARRGELLRMEMEHVDLESGTIEVPITKTKQPRVVALTPDAVERLGAWLQIRYSWKPETQHVWLTRRGSGPVTPMTANGARLMVERRRHAAGLDHLSSHAFRRGWAVHSLRAGVSQVSVERLGGWRPGSPMVSKYSRTLGQKLALDEYRRAFGESA